MKKFLVLGAVVCSLAAFVGCGSTEEPAAPAPAPATGAETVEKATEAVSAEGATAAEEAVEGATVAEAAAEGATVAEEATEGATAAEEAAESATAAEVATQA